MPALILLYAILGMPFDPAWLDMTEPRPVLDTRMDVPAVQVEAGDVTCHGSCASGTSGICAPIMVCGKEKRWTCEDNLTSEDGQKHCVLFAEPKSDTKLYCHYAWIIPVYEGKDAPGEAQMFRLCEVSK